jgi:hypothetical protein
VATLRTFCPPNLNPRHHFLITYQLPFQPNPFHPHYCPMADQFAYAQFQDLFDTALHTYEKKTGVKLAKHPLALQLQDCHTVDEIASLLQGQAQAFSDFRANDKIFKSIKIIVSILSPLSSAASLADNFGVVRQKVPIICFTSLTDFLYSFHLGRQYTLV